MTDQATGAAAQPAETSSVQDDIRAAFAEVEGNAAPEKPAAAAPDRAGETPEAAAQRARDEKGRFARAEGTEQAKEPAEGETAPGVETKPAEGEQAATAPGEPPQHWSAEDKALVAKLPPEMRGEYIDRFKRMEAGFAPKLQRAAELEKHYGEVDKMFEPAMPAMQAQGWTKTSLIKAWAQVEEGLARDPIEQVGKIIKHYKVDTAEMVKRLGLTGGGAPAAAAAEGAAQPGAAAAEGEYVDPTVKALQDQIKQLTGTVTGLTTAQQEARAAEETARTQRTLNEIQAFADAKGEDGSPSHPLFSEVLPNILALAAAERSAGRTPTLATLYDQAVWANPETRAKQLAADRLAEQKAKAAADKDKAAAARKAGSSVTGSPSGSGQTPKSGSLGNVKDDVRAAFHQVA